MSGRAGGSRVPIPNNVRKTIEDIREISGKQHGDDEIYAVLKDCAMDPNETAQKLLYLDTFHEVKGRRNRKKENFTTHSFEESRSKQGGQGRAARALQGGYFSNYSDGFGNRNVNNREENGVSYIAERTVVDSSVPFTQKSKRKVAILVTRTSTTVPNGPANELNGSSSHGIAPHASVGGVTSVSKAMSPIDISKQDDVQSQASILSTPTPTFISVMKADQGKPRANQVLTTASVASVSGVYSSSSDPVLGLLAPSASWDPSVGAIKREVGSQQLDVGQNLVKANKLTANGFSDIVPSKTEKGSSGSGGSIQKEKSQNKFKEIEKTQLSEMQRPSTLSTSDAPLATRSTTSFGLSNLPQADKATPLEVSNVEDHKQLNAESKQHVTFPNHFQVPEAVKNGLTFGSFEDSFGWKETCSSGKGGDSDSTAAVESSLGSEEPATATVSGPESTNIEAKQEIQLTTEGTQDADVQNAQNYSMNFMSTMLGTHHMQFEGSNPQMPETSHILHSGGNPPVLSSQAPIPPLQSSISVSPQSISLFRPPYAANYIPYSHYYPPIYLSPIHQYLGHNGFHQQPSAGNMYLPAAATGIKLPIPQFKPGTNAGSHFGILSSSFISPSLGYAASPALNTGSSNGNGDLVATQLKENHIYTTGQLTEGSAMWIPAPGQDISSFQINSLYNIPPPQRQNLSFPPAQVSHGGFAGVYQPGQTVSSGSTLLQQSQAVTGTLEPAGLTSGAYQEPKNWNSKF